MKGYVVKLVRDRIGDRVGPNRSFHYEAIKPGSEQHVKLLRAKLLEEVGEYLIEPSIGELADVLQVVRALAAVDLDVPMLDVMDEADEKRQERGDFTEGTVMVATDEGWSGDPRPEWGEG